MGVRDVGRRGHAGSRTAHRRAFTALESIEEHLCFTQVRARLDDSLTGFLGSLAGLCFSVLHAAPPSPCSSDACRASSALVFRRCSFAKTAA